MARNGKKSTQWNGFHRSFYHTHIHTRAQWWIVNWTKRRTNIFLSKSVFVLIRRDVTMSCIFHFYGRTVERGTEKKSYDFFLLNWMGSRHRQISCVTRNNIRLPAKAQTLAHSIYIYNFWIWEMVRCVCKIVQAHLIVYYPLLWLSLKWLKNRQTHKVMNGWMDGCMKTCFYARWVGLTECCRTYSRIMY